MLKSRGAAAVTHGVAVGLAISLGHVLAVVALGLTAHPACGAGIFTPLDAADSAHLAHHAASQVPSAAGPSVDGDRPPKGWLVRVDRPRLFKAIHGAARHGSGRILLNVAEGLEFDVAVERTGPTLSGHSLSGSVVGVAGGAVTLVVNAEVLVGTVWTPKAAYEIAPVKDGVHVFREVGPSAAPRLCEPVQAEGSWGELPLVERTDAEGDEVVDVLILWTPKAVENAGSDAQMRATSDLAVAWTNDAYERSGAAVRLNLVGAEQVDYVEYCQGLEPGECHIAYDLYRLRNPSDGFLDEAHERRDSLGADLVSLFVGEASGAEGVAGLAGPYSVIWLRPGCYGQPCEETEQWPTSYTFHILTVFAHELGHNMGLLHERGSYGSVRGVLPLRPGYIDSVLPFSYGYVNKLAFEPSGRADDCWGTIMAGGRVCIDHGFPYWGGRVPYFSTPDRHHPENEDAPLGVPKESDDGGRDGPADAVRTLNLTLPAVANLRSGRVDDGDTAETATAIPATSTTVATLTGRDDVDYFRIELPEAGRVRVEITDGFYDLRNADVALVTGDGELIAEDRGYPLLIEAELTAGVYFVKVYDGYGGGVYALVVSFNPASAADIHGDGTQEATVAGLPSNAAGELQNPGDVDYFRFVVPERGMVRLETAGDTDVVGTLTFEDGALNGCIGDSLHGHCVSLIDDDGGTAANFLLVATLDPGVYFVAVTGFLGATGSYSLELSFTPLSEAPDDHADSPDAATRLEVGASTSGELEVTLDRDYFRFAVAERSAIRLETIGDTDVVLTLTSEDGSFSLADDGGAARNSRLIARLDPGVYFVRVTGLAGIATGPYSLTLSVTAPDDHADSPDAATDFEAGASISGALEAGLDRDYFRIEVADSPGQLWVESTGDTDVEGSLLSRDGVLLDEAKHGGGGRNFVVGAYVVPGSYFLRVAAADGTDIGPYELAATFIADTRALPLFISASHAVRHGFARIINRSDRSGDVAIHAIDDAGHRHGPVTLSLDAGQTAHFNADDLENGNEPKGLSAGVGAGEGDWRLELATDLDIEALAYVRTNDGFLTSMHGISGMHDASEVATVPTFNPASNFSQVSKLRFISQGPKGNVSYIQGRDDSGGYGRVILWVAEGTSLTVTAQELENGSEEFLSNDRLGDGDGKWRLHRYQPWRQPVGIMSLLESPTGHLTNLSRRTPIVGTDVSLPLFIAAGNPARQGFARIINYSHVGGRVTIHAIDDAGQRHGPVTLSLSAYQAAHFNSHDLENGNLAKGLSGGVGSGDGDWRLEFSATAQAHELDDMRIEALAYVRTADGFLTGMNALVPSSNGRREVVFFNPASNNRQVSKLRLVNPADADAAVSISGIDDAGNAAPAGDITLTVPAGAAAEITAQQLEAGAGHFDGRFGDGQGKWRLFIEADKDIQAMSLLESPTGHIANLSSGTAVR